MSINGTIIQFFHDNDDCEESLWASLKKETTKLSRLGFTAAWLPPAFKGALGAKDDGYTPYDLYDLGEYNQKGTISTKYGNKEEYIDAIKSLHQKKINVYTEIVIDKKHGADEIEYVDSEDFMKQDNCQMVGKNKKIVGLSKFTFPGRNHEESNYEYSWKDFSYIEWNKEKAIHDLNKNISVEQLKELDNGNFIIGNKINYNNSNTKKELIKWGQWYQKNTKLDGFVFDANYDLLNVYKDLFENVRHNMKTDLFGLTKMWQWNVDEIKKYIDCFGGKVSAIDVPLHYNLYNCSKGHGDYDLRKIFDGTLVSERPYNAITFVDNSDTLTGGIFESTVEDWFKKIAYSLILLRKDGYPVVSYPDYVGECDVKNFKKDLDKILKLRVEKAYGEQHDYFDNPNCIGWTREGVADIKDSGMAVVISDGIGGTKRMYIGKQFAGAHFSDALGNAKYNIKIDDNGYGDFYVNRGAVAVWIRKENKKQVI